MCFFWFRFFASLVTGTLHQQPCVFSRIVFHWPWHQIEQQNGNQNVLSKTRDPKKKRGKFFKYGNLLKNHQYFWRFSLYLIKKSSPQGRDLFPFFWLFLGLFVYTALDIFLRQLQIAIPKKIRSYFRFGHVCLEMCFVSLDLDLLLLLLLLHVLLLFFSLGNT